MTAQNEERAKTLMAIAKASGSTATEPTEVDKLLAKKTGRTYGMFRGVRNGKWGVGPDTLKMLDQLAPDVDKSSLVKKGNQVSKKKQTKRKPASRSSSSRQRRTSATESLGVQAEWRIGTMVVDGEERAIVVLPLNAKVKSVQMDMAERQLSIRY